MEEGRLVQDEPQFLVYVWKLSLEHTIGDCNEKSLVLDVIFKFLIKNYYLPFKKEKKNYEKQDKPLQATHFSLFTKLSSSVQTKWSIMLRCQMSREQKLDWYLIKPELGPWHRQSNRGDGGVALSEFSIRLCPGFFMIFSILDHVTLRVLARIVLRQTVLPPSTTKISQKNHFYEFIYCNFKQRTVS